MPISTSSYKVNPKYRKISGVRNLGPRTIDLTSIVVDIGKNHTRSTGINDTHVNKLVAYMKEHGIDASLPCPIVYYDENGNPQLVDGYHRTKAQKRLGLTTMDVDVYEFEDEFALRAIQSMSNMHPPQLDADVESLVTTIQDEIEGDVIRDHEDDIMDRVNILAEGKPLEFRKNVCTEVVKRNGSIVRWISYDDADSTDFLRNESLTTNFRWNAVTERYGAVITSSSEWRVIYRAVKQYNSMAPNGKKGVQTDMVIKVEKKGDANTMLKRYKVIETAMDMLQDMLDATGSTEWAHGHPPIRFVGALPQDAGSTYEENRDDGLILIDPDTNKFII